MHPAGVRPKDGARAKRLVAPATPPHPQVNDLFPGLDCPRVRYPRLNDEIEAELAAGGFQVRAHAARRLPLCARCTAAHVSLGACCVRRARERRSSGTTDHGIGGTRRIPTPAVCVLSPSPSPAQVLTAAGDQVDKVVQLYEVMLTRHTTMVVGQTGGGKSVILQTLAKAQVPGAWSGECESSLLALLSSNTVLQLPVPSAVRPLSSKPRRHIGAAMHAPAPGAPRP